MELPPDLFIMKKIEAHQRWTYTCDACDHPWQKVRFPIRCPMCNKGMIHCEEEYEEEDDLEEDQFKNHTVFLKCDYCGRWVDEKWDLFDHIWRELEEAKPMIKEYNSEGNIIKRLCEK